MCTQESTVCTSTHNHEESSVSEVLLYFTATIITGTVMRIQWWAVETYDHIGLKGDTIHVGSDFSIHVGSLIVAILLLIAFFKQYGRKIRSFFGWFGVLILGIGAIHVAFESVDQLFAPCGTVDWVLFAIVVCGGMGNVFVHLLLHHTPLKIKNITHAVMSAHVRADMYMSAGVATSILARYSIEQVVPGLAAYAIYINPITGLCVAAYMIYLVKELSGELLGGKLPH